MNIAGWSSSVARRAHNPKVIGSNPIPATIILNLEYTLLQIFVFVQRLHTGSIIDLRINIFLVCSSEKS